MKPTKSIFALTPMAIVAACAGPSPPPPNSAGATPSSSAAADQAAATGVASNPASDAKKYREQPGVAEYIREHGLCTPGSAPTDNDGGVLGEERSDGGKPRIWAGRSEMTGRLPPEVIQYVVRQKYYYLQTCYENGLRTNPRLEGRVAVKFIIERDGTVSHVNNGGSDLPDQDAIACVRRVFESMCFPPVENGIVTVVYPIMYSPDPVGHVQYVANLPDGG